MLSLVRGEQAYEECETQPERAGPCGNTRKGEGEEQRGLCSGPGSYPGRTETPGTSLSGGGDIAQQLRPAAMGQKKAN